MNRVLFCGAGYGAGNIGDDAILAGLLTSSRMHLLKDTEYGAVVFSRAYTKERAGVDRVFYFDGGVTEAFNWATHIVLGGATLLSDWSIEYCSDLIILAQRMDKPICMLAVGVSDEPPDDLKELLRIHYGSLDMITFRSETDKKAAIDMGLSTEKLWVCADGAFAIDCGDTVYDPLVTLGINLVHEGLPERYPYVRTVTQLLTEMPRDSEFSFICGETRKEELYDFFLLRDLHQRFGGSFFCEYVDYPDLLKVLASCRIVLTMRMHMMLFCSLIGVPCIPIIRSHKMKLMADEIGFNRIISLDETSFSLQRMVSIVLKYPDVAVADADKIDELKKRSMTNGLMLQKWGSKTL